jgi:hypothetical protein
LLFWLGFPWLVVHRWIVGFVLRWLRRPSVRVIINRFFPLRLFSDRIVLRWFNWIFVFVVMRRIPSPPDKHNSDI